MKSNKTIKKRPPRPNDGSLITCRQSLSAYFYYTIKNRGIIMTIKKYKKQGKTFYKFQIRLGEKVTTRSGFKSKPQAMYAYTQLLEDYENDIQSNIPYKEVYKD